MLIKFGASLPLLLRERVCVCADIYVSVMDAYVCSRMDEHVRVMDAYVCTHAWKRSRAR